MDLVPHRLPGSLNSLRLSGKVVFNNSSNATLRPTEDLWQEVILHASHSVFSFRGWGATPHY